MKRSLDWEVSSYLADKEMPHFMKSEGSFPLVEDTATKSIRISWIQSTSHIICRYWSSYYYSPVYVHISSIQRLLLLYYVVDLLTKPS